MWCSCSLCYSKDTNPYLSNMSLLRLQTKHKLIESSCWKFFSSLKAPNESTMIPNNTFIRMRTITAKNIMSRNYRNDISPSNPPSPPSVPGRYLSFILSATPPPFRIPASIVTNIMWIRLLSNMKEKSLPFIPPRSLKNHRKYGIEMT